MFSHFRKHIRAYRRSHGFTQLELLIIVFLIGILTTLAVPNVNGFLESARAKQAAVELRGALQQTQRQSIRKNSSCSADIRIPNTTSEGTPFVSGNCLASGEVGLPQGISLATNVISAPVDSLSTLESYPQRIHRAGFLKNLFNCFVSKQCSLPSVSGLQEKEVSITFGRLGAAHFQVAAPENSTPPQDYSAKFVAVRLNNISAPKPCVVVSGSLGLTRIGSYAGPLDPESISEDGVCQADHWSQQQ